MSFSTSPKSGPSVLAPPTSTANATSSAQAARERAIAMLSNSAPQSPSGAPEAPPEVMHAQARGNTAEEVQNTTIEAVETPEAPAEPATEDTTLSPHYAALARKERALRAKVAAQHADIKAKEASIAEREKAIAAKEAEYSTDYIRKSKFKEDPWSVMADEGVTYDELTQRALTQQSQDPAVKAALARMEAQVNALKEEQANSRKLYQESQAQSYQQALNQITLEAKDLVKNDPAFEAIRETGSVKDVVQLIEKTFEQEGRLMTVEEAAREVEEYLVDETLKLTRLQKIQQRLKQNAAKAASTTTNQQPQSETKQPQLKTLTNAAGTTRQLSARERAMLAFKGELKS